MNRCFDKLWALARLAIGFNFFWAFIDKLLGLGISTCYDAAAQKYMGFMCEGGAWLNGGSPTYGFLKFATKGPFTGLFQSMASSHVVEWLFMLGLFGVGTAMMLGIASKIASISAVAMLSLMYLSMLWPTTNPFVDQHLIQIVIIFGFICYDPGNTWGFGKWWKQTKLVKKYTWLE